MKEPHNHTVETACMGDACWRQGEPYLGGIYGHEELSAIMDVVTQSSHPSSGFQADNAVYTFEERCRHKFGGKHAIAVNSGGTALDLVLRAMQLAPSDEIVSCAINFVGTHLAVIGQNARLVLCEPDPGTLNIDPVDVERVLSCNTRAILATHMNGLSVDIDALLDIAERHPHPQHGPPRVICDAARACGAWYKGRPVGRGPWATIYSFHSKKIITTLGEGGMVITDDDALARTLQAYRAFGRGHE